MTGRITYGALAILAIFTLIAADAAISTLVPVDSGAWGDLLAAGSVIPIACAIIALLAARELIDLLRRQRIVPHSRWAMFASVALVIVPWLAAAGWLMHGPIAREMIHIQLAAVAMAFFGAGIAQLFNRDQTGAAERIAATWLIITYAGFLPSFLLLLRCDVDVPASEGPWIVLVVLAVCKVSDIGAYFVGSWFGKHKLIPWVSPGKSWEGLAGGIAASVSVSLLFVFLYHWTLPGENPFAGDPTQLDSQTIWADAEMRINSILAVYRNLDITQAIVIAMVISVFGQLGDLFESTLKRAAGAKDSGNILPGFGGILDMIDSPVAAAPIAWFLLTQGWSVL